LAVLTLAASIHEQSPNINQQANNQQVNSQQAV